MKTSVKSLAFSYDGHGLNDATDPHRPRVLTFARKARDMETAAEQDRIGRLLAAAPAMRAALEKLVDAYEDALTVHIYDESNGEEIPPEEHALVAEARAALAAADKGAP
jgi:hypothetical protein